MDVKQALASVIKTLGCIEVKGRENLDKLLGSIIMLEKVLAETAERGEANAADKHD